MTDADCRRWISLSDRQATEESISDAETAWLRQHASVCPHCGGEERLWSSLADVVGKPEQLTLVPEPDANRRSRATRRETAGRFDRRLVWGLGLAASLALTLSTAALMLRSPSPKDARTVLPSIRPSSVQMLSVAGEVRVGLRPARAGDLVGENEQVATTHGRACIGIAGSVTTCLDEETTASLSYADPTQLVVNLKRGRLMSRLDRQPTHRSFMVSTAQTSIIAKGTQFLVEVDAEHRTRVHLHEGSIALRTANNLSTDMIAPSQAVVAREIHKEPWSEQIVEEDRVLAGLSNLPRTGQRTRLDVVTKPAGATVAVDDMVIGPSPVSALLSGGYRLQVSLAGYATVKELLAAGHADVLERSFELSKLPSLATADDDSPNSRQSLGARVTPASAGTPGMLLARAQSLRSASRYHECALAYRKLIARYPRSDEARVSLVSLGELELSELAQPRQALRDFEDYLRKDGPLAREARFGQIRALRMLSRSTEEKEAITAFLRDYPRSVQAESLRRQHPSR